MLAPVLTGCALLFAACKPSIPLTRGHGHTVEYNDPVKLAQGIEQLDRLRQDAISRGYRVTSTGESTDGSNAEMVTIVLTGREPELGDVELSLEWWDRIRPDQPEIRVHVSATFEVNRTGSFGPPPPEWQDLLERIEHRVQPRYFRE